VPVKSVENPGTLNEPFKEVASNVPEKVTSVGVPLTGIFITKLNFSPEA
jgi:hypothetical protein